MARTRRKTPINQLSQAQRLEREFERQVGKAKRPQAESSYYDEPDDMRTHLPLPRDVQVLKREAEAIANARIDMSKARATAPYSVQTPATDDPMTTGGSFLWWIGGELDQYIPVSEYGDPKRESDLRAFALVAPMVLNAESVLTKKAQSMQWTIEGGRNQAKKWQERLNSLENGDGWDIFIGRWVRAYCESDRGGYAELIRAAPLWALDDNGHLTPRGERLIEKGDDASWEIVDARVMDSANCFPTTSKEFPLEYHNPWTGKIHFLRQYQYMHLLDQPSVDDRYPSMGVCCVSRAVWMAQEDRMVIRYAMEAMSENPGAGIMLGNVAPNLLKTALDTAAGEREARGVIYYKGVIFLPVLDPSGRVSLEFISFSHLPDNFDRQEIYNITKEVVATAFGLDVLEFGSIPGRLGTALQARVAQEKAAGKSIGSIMQGVERNLRYKMLPEGITFSIKKQDLQEEAQRAEVNRLYFENAIDMFEITGQPLLSMQYLANVAAIPNEAPFIDVDLTAREQVVDVQPAREGEEQETKPLATETASAEGPEGTIVSQEAENVGKRLKQYESRVRLDREGRDQLQVLRGLEHAVRAGNAYHR